MPHTAKRGHQALRRGRWSAPRAEYFLTICTDGRAGGLSTPRLVAAILGEAHQLTTETHWFVRTATVMSDHVHLVVQLAARTELPAAIRLFKGRLSPALRAAHLKWQHGYFDHRLRVGEKLLPVFLYIFLNPYRAGLISQSDMWPGYYCCSDDWEWFQPLTNGDLPVPAWLL
jgi:REP element-mobilizing transposase RayT